jgi:primosomal replication protein N
VDADGANQASLGGRLVERSALRHTPAGLPVLEFSIAHASRQIEAGLPRRVECEVAAVALGQTAEFLAAAPLGSAVVASGFMAAKGAHNRRLVLHVTNIEFLEGSDNGIQTQEQDGSQTQG